MLPCIIYYHLLGGCTFHNISLIDHGTVLLYPLQEVMFVYYTTQLTHGTKLNCNCEL